MASITTDPNGFRRIGFIGPDGKSKTVRLGDVPLNVAEEFRDNIQHLVATHNAQHLTSEKALVWVAGLADKHYRRLAAAGLVKPRPEDQPAAATLKKLTDDVRAELAHMKPNTIRNYDAVIKLLLKKFGAQCSVVDISARQADEFVAWMRNEQNLGPATVARKIKACRYIFNRAVRWEMAAKNPFNGIKAGSSVNPARKAFVHMADVEKVMAMTNDLEFRAVIALSRIGALRCPSEVVLLRWSDVGWDNGQLRVRSPKTEGYAGKDCRIVPLFPRLYEILLELHSSLPEGAGEFVISQTRDPGINWRKKLLSLIEKSGVKQWDKLFHNMRASRESELCQDYPLATVCEWIGHNPSVAAEHYLMDPNRDASFQKAIGKATRNPTRSDENLGVFEGSGEQANQQNPQENADYQGNLRETECARKESNLQPLDS